MSRGLFDLDVTVESSGTKIPCISLSELGSTIQNAIKQAVGTTRVWVAGEVRDLRYNFLKDHYYLKLVESRLGGEEIVASISATIWSNNSSCVKTFEQLTGQKFTDKLQVKVLCEVAFHPQYGLSLVISDIDANFTIGNLEASRQMVLDTLLRQVLGVSLQNGVWHSPNKMLQLPRVIQRIALLTARDSDAYRDFTHEITNNNFGYHFDVTPYFIPVEGKESSLMIERAFKQITLGKKAYDVIVLTRGGGADTDLLTFDTLSIGKMIAQCPIPVITGIGHERNMSVADHMASISTKTPTKCGTYIIEWNHSFEMAIKSHLQAILNNSSGKLHQYATEFNVIKERLRTSISKKLNLKINQVERLKLTLISRLNSYFLAKLHSIELLQQQIKLTDPNLILSKGFVLVKQDGKIVPSGKALDSGDQIDLIFHDQKREARLK